ncbi:hypothetical protein [Lapillicoccus jejuensis]|uniref:Uncharacterized protein n=1 Tax=Lapillicoccus jejuensis TaxID=402171 RepID=A0A542E3K6_9MICO|nr:hypothetical protein [Lapillicoccus jejuensis]TQJ09923.1 hypothetical protein FB458_3039 [Lapillicoccus jejuensis]
MSLDPSTPPTAGSPPTPPPPPAGPLGELLRALLEGPYRPVWRPHARRVRADGLNALAIAAVLAAWLRRHPQRPGDEQAGPEQLDDLVRQALLGRVSPDRLEAFVGAFGLTPDEADALRATSAGDTSTVVVGWPGRVPPGGAPVLTRPAGYDVVSLRELHVLGADGTPVSHHFTQRIRAQRTDVHVVRHVFEPAHETVSLVAGGSPGAPYALDGDRWAVDIALPQPLAAGAETTLEISSRTRWEPPVDPVLRHVARGRLRDVELAVQFHPDRLPQEVWWARWAGIRGPRDTVLHRERLTLDGQHRARRHLHVLERAVVGFIWSLDGPDPTSRG